MGWFSKFMREFMLVGEVGLEVCMLVNMTSRFSLSLSQNASLKYMGMGWFLRSFD